MNTNKTQHNAQELEIILIQVRNAMPSEIDQIAKELSEIPGLAHTLVGLMGQEKFLKECYHLLTRLSATDSVMPI